MKKMTKWMAVILSGLLALSALTACGSGDKEDGKRADKDDDRESVTLSNTASNETPGIGDEEIELDAPTSEGLVYALNSAGTEYTVTGYTGTGTNVRIPATYQGLPVTSIGKRAFCENEIIKNVSIPDSIVIIEEDAFWDCDSLMDITIPDSVMVMGRAAFYNCENLVSVTLGNGLTNISSCVFQWCTQLTEITIPNGLTAIEGSAFSYCTNLKTVVFPDSLTTIGSFAFAECQSLKNIVIPDSVTTIANGAFEACTGLISVTLGSGVTDVDDGAFRDCRRIAEVVHRGPREILSASIETHGGSSKMDCVDGYFFYTYEGTHYLLGYDGNVAELVLPDTYRGENYEIYKSAFFECDWLESVSISDGVTRIGSTAFGSCANLQSVTMGDNVTNIEYWAFHNCGSLRSITIPAGVTNIGRCAFYLCNSLSNATFENTENWISGDVTIASNELSVPSVAARHLRDIYSNNTWTRS